MSRLNKPDDLTPRQREVLALLARGYTNAAIGGQLGISLDGAKWHVSELLGRLNLESREEAADYWRAQQGLRPRLFRFTRVLGPLASWKALAGVVAALVVAGGAAVGFLSRGDDTLPPGVVTPPGATATPSARRTGIAEIDRIIDLIVARDRPAVLALFDGFPEVCTNDPDKNPYAPCPPGTPEGTTILTTRAQFCEGRTSLPSFLEFRFRFERELAAVFRPAGGLVANLYPAGEYALIFSVRSTVPGEELLERFDVRDGRISGMWQPCGPDPRAFVFRDSAVEVVAPPPPKPTPTPTPPPNADGYPPGWSPVSNAAWPVTQALDSRDPARIEAHLIFQPAYCSAFNNGAPLPAFCKGLASTGPVPAFPVVECNRFELRERGQVDDILKRLASTHVRLFAVYVNVPIPGDTFRFHGAPVVVVLNFTDLGKGARVYVESGMVVSVDFGCGETAREMAGDARPVSRFILPPPPP